MVASWSSQPHGGTCYAPDMTPKKTAQHLKEEGLLMADDAGGKLQRQEKVLRGGDVVTARFYVLDTKIINDSAGTGSKESAQ